MSLLQPWTSWIFLAVLLPIVIHMLNRLRYRTVHWAAMIFLLKANKAATRRAKLRQYLLLLFRSLILFFLLWAMMRPIVGGWLGSAAGGAPEVVLVVLDRSSSMEGRAPESQESKRQHALALLAQAAKQSAGSRFVLIENVLRQPLEIADTASLGAMQMAEATDTAADIPAMLRTALDYLVKNKPGSAEVWLASDLQASNWRPDSAEWQDIAARFTALPQETRMRVLDLSSSGGTNLSVAVKGADFRPARGATDKRQLSLALEIKTGGATGTFPLLVTRDGAKSQTDLVLNATVQRQTLKFDVPKLTEGGGWGKVELPADDHPGDNAAYFVYRAPTPLAAAVVATLPGSGASLRYAAAPDKTRTDRTAELLAPTGATGIRWKETALVVWQGPAPEDAVAKQLQAFVESGGVVLAFPTGAESSAGPLGLSWGAIENSGKDLFRVTNWDERDGPLSNTDNGTALSLARLEVSRRQLAHIAGETAHVYATFADGQPFLTGQRIGAGTLLACATLPETEWSTLGEGFVILPLVQRALVLGGSRLAPPAMAVAGEWQPGDMTWSSVETDRRRDPRWHAGLYQSAGRHLALNRPDIEDNADTVARERLPELLRGVKLTVLAGALDLKADRLQSEIWPAMVIATMAFMCLEMLLATSKTLIPQRPKARAAKPAEKKEEVAV